MDGVEGGGSAGVVHRRVDSSCHCRKGLPSRRRWWWWVEILKGWWSCCEMEKWMGQQLILFTLSPLERDARPICHVEFLGDVPPHSPTKQSISGFRLIGRDNDSEGRKRLWDINSQSPTAQEQPQYRWIKICRGIWFYFKVRKTVSREWMTMMMLMEGSIGDFFARWTFLKIYNLYPLLLLIERETFLNCSPWHICTIRHTGLKYSGSRLRLSWTPLRLRVLCMCCKSIVKGRLFSITKF